MKDKCKKCSDVRYCSYCGKQMVLSLVVHTNYDSHTGERINSHYHTWRCPNYKGLGVLKHDKFSDVPSGDF